ncbi:predicted protein [Chaetoceros tenuissimus]|uniref:Uncharacterized protein n=1 Tax=Chaetoceros tenuissimus TaxID=426638 RepID=A0AAD3D297_9STRA|nr:predicted protein [Chaetoceros tenuissimus]
MFEPFADHSQQPLMRASISGMEGCEDSCCFSLAASLEDKDEIEEQKNLFSSPCCSVDNFDPILVSPSTVTTKDVILFDQDMMEDWWESDSMHEDTTLEKPMEREEQQGNASHQGEASEDGSTPPHNVKPSTRKDLMTLYLEQVLLEIKNMNIPFVCGDIWAPSETNESYSTDDQALLVDYPFLHRYSSIVMKGAPETISADIVASELAHSFLLGLVGRVYTSKRATVDRDVHEMVGNNMSHVKSVVGIPVHNKRFGNFVALFYSLDEINLDKRLLDEVKKICERVIFDENDNVYTVKGKQVSTFSSALFSSNEIEELVSLLSKHIPADDSKAESSPDFFASIQAFISLRIILLRPASSYTADEKAYLQTIKQSWFSYLKNSTLDENDIANRLVREWMFLNKCGISPTSIW